MKIEKVIVSKVENGGSLKAFAAFVLDDCFAVHNVKVIEGKKGLFIAMPSRKVNNEFKDICHPIKQEFREKIEKAILEEYFKEVDSNEKN